MKNMRFIIEGRTDNGNDYAWETVGLCNDPGIAREIHEHASNFAKFDILEVSEMQEDGSYNFISMRKLESYQ